MSEKLIQQWQQQLAKHKLRGVVFQFSRSNNQLENVLFSNVDEKDKIISPCLVNNSVQKLQKLLGREHLFISVDTTNGFDPNYFSAIVGTLKGGGILNVILDQKLSSLISRLFDFKNTGGASVLTEELSSFDLAETLKRFIIACLWNSTTSILLGRDFKARDIKPDFSDCSADALEDQKQLVDKVVRVANGRANRPLVITADRGRGKSAALGFASHKLIAESSKKIIVTSPSETNLVSFKKHFSSKAANEDFSSFKNNSNICFLPADKIIAEAPRTDLLIVDEAAAIPVTLLEKLAMLYSRIVFSSTTNGYEGNGKGFDIRFKQKLMNIKPQTRFANLSLPIRWARNDELEASCYRAFMLNYKLAKIPEELNSYHFKVLSKKSLVNNQVLLNSVFALLVNAHYQTRPADLEQLLSHSSTQVMALINANYDVAAVALVNKEGNFNEQLCDQIYQSKKRLKGDLLPQSLIAHYGEKKAGRLNFFRIMRIAVHPDLQNKNLGSRLITHINTEARAQDIEIVGASFAADFPVINFWLKNQFEFTRFGSAKDSSSGQHTCECFRQVKPQQHVDFRSLKSRFAATFLFKLSNELQSIDNQIVFRLLNNAQRDDYQTLTRQQQQELWLFCQGARSYSMIDWLLYRQLIDKLTRSLSFSSDIDLLIDICLKHLGKPVIIQKHNLTGKKHLDSELRRACESLLEANLSNAFEQSKN